MQNSPTSTKKFHGHSTRPIPKPEGDEHSFTSFKPLSPESTKGSFSLSKFFQWKSSEPKPLPKTSEAQNVPRVEVKNEAEPKCSPTPSQGRSSPSSLRSKIPRSWSSPRFQRRQGSGLSSSPGQGKQPPQGYRNLSALFKRLSAVADSSKGDQVIFWEYCTYKKVVFINTFCLIYSCFVICIVGALFFKYICWWCLFLFC